MIIIALILLYIVYQFVCTAHKTGISRMDDLLFQNRHKTHCFQIKKKDFMPAHLTPNKKFLYRTMCINSILLHFENTISGSEGKQRSKVDLHGDVKVPKNEKLLAQIFI